MDRSRILDRLDHILSAIDAVESYVAGKSVDDFHENPMLLDAVERNLERLSEASRHIPDALTENHPEVPWRQVADIGNVLRHAYDRVDARRIWETVERDLGPLKSAVLSIKSTLEKSGS